MTFALSDGDTWTRCVICARRPPIGIQEELL